MDYGAFSGLTLGSYISMHLDRYIWYICAFETSQTSLMFRLLQQQKPWNQSIEIHNVFNKQSYIHWDPRKTGPSLDSCCFQTYPCIFIDAYAIHVYTGKLSICPYICSLTTTRGLKQSIEMQKELLVSNPSKESHRDRTSLWTTLMSANHCANLQLHYQRRKYTKQLPL